MVFVAFLRGINVGGNNMVSMKALTESFERLGFTDVRTYINSGNIIFAAKEEDPRKVEDTIDRMLSRDYGLQGKTVVRNTAEMARVVKMIEKTWGEPDAESRYNVIFLRHTIDSKRVLDGVELNADVERAVYCPGTLLWSTRIDGLARSVMHKLASKPNSREMTVRNINTTMKVFALMQQVTPASSRRRRAAARR